MVAPVTETGNRRYGAASAVLEVAGRRLGNREDTPVVTATQRKDIHLT